ncbi:hypothetical protein [Catellatospora methionotrophica]|uniref:hypothetical protein n=1 Tax=Catellatospora methionotrophica TaxID=121620 RepID=UPI0033C411A9
MKARTWIVIGAVVTVAAVVACVVGIAVLRPADDIDTPWRQAPGGSPLGQQDERLAPSGAPFSYAMPEGWVRAVHDGAPNYMTSVGPPLGIGKSGAVVGVALISESDPQDVARRVYDLSQQAGPVPQDVTVTDVMLASHMATRIEFSYDQDGIYVRQAAQRAHPVRGVPVAQP